MSTEKTDAELLRDWAAAERDLDTVSETACGYDEDGNCTDPDYNAATDRYDDALTEVVARREEYLSGTRPMPEQPGEVAGVCEYTETPVGDGDDRLQTACGIDVTYPHTDFPPKGLCYCGTPYAPAIAPFNIAELRAEVARLNRQLGLANAAILGLEVSLWIVGANPSKFAAAAVDNYRASAVTEAAPMPADTDEIADLKRWKAEALSVMPPMQEIGKALELQLGDSIHDKILPGITALTARVAELEEALSAIRQYGSDTLSGRADGPDDREWQRGAVLEMTKRARIALTKAQRGPEREGL